MDLSNVPVFAALSQVGPTCVELLAVAADPGDPMTLAFAGVIGNASRRSRPYDVPIAGLDAEALAALSRRFFPRLSPPLARDRTYLDPPSAPDEFRDLVELLSEHRSSADLSVSWLAHAVATACMEGNHLWQDMGLPDRGVLSAVLDIHFTSLARLNTGDMKWKKFFYRELCRRAGLLLCKSPSCGACVDYPKCFGPEI